MRIFSYPLLVLLWGWGVLPFLGQTAAAEDISPADQGYRLYREGKFEEAAPLLQKAADNNNPLAQELFADICYRNLDDKVHPLKEAAMYYVLAASGGDPDAQAYVEGKVPGINLTEDKNPDAHMNALVQCWVVEETLRTLKPIKVSTINNFWMAHFGKQINTTQAMKIPYFFDQVVHAVCYELGLPPLQSVEEDREEDERKSPVPSIYSCAQEALDQSFTRERPIAAVRGPLYFSYWLSKDKQPPGSDTYLLPRPHKKPNIEIIYEKILAAIHTTLQNDKAWQMVDKSHQDEPWILAGMRYWKKKNSSHRTLLSQTEEKSVLEQLEKMEEPLSEDQKARVLKKIESPTAQEIWPNKEDDMDEVMKEFQDNLSRFFASPLSRDKKHVKEAVKYFFADLKTATLNLLRPHEGEILKHPFCLYFMKELTLTHVGTGHYKLLQGAQRYFAHLETLSISFADNMKKSKKFKEMKGLIKSIRGTHGIKIEFPDPDVESSEDEEM